jgi:hypothetical protein
MRQLTSQELEWIHTRLKSLHIRYTEVYEEILDHYCTKLENTPELESPRAIAKLNQTFAYSVVKKMDKELAENVSKKVNQAQLEYLKFWDFGSKGFLIALGVVIGVVLFFTFVPETELIIVSLIVIPIGSILAQYILGKRLYFTLKHKPVDIWAASVARRISLFASIFVWIYFMPWIFLGDEVLAGPILSITTLIVAFLGILYAVSLFVVAFNSPNQKTV